IAVITALLLLPCVFAMGIGVDYTLAHQKQNQINGYADAAVLAAVSPAAMLLNSTDAQTTSMNVFLAQVNTMTDVQYSPSDVTVTVTDARSGTALNRVTTLTYKAKSPTLFASVIGLPTLPIGGTSSSTNGISPQINFYLLLDTSPSMEIA